MHINSIIHMYNIIYVFITTHTLYCSVEHSSLHLYSTTELLHVTLHWNKPVQYHTHEQYYAIWISTIYLNNSFVEVYGIQYQYTDMDFSTHFYQIHDLGKDFYPKYSDIYIFFLCKITCPLEEEKVVLLILHPYNPWYKPLHPSCLNLPLFDKKITKRAKNCNQK